MGLKSFLVQQGFIAADHSGDTKNQGDAEVTSNQLGTTISPTFFPLNVPATSSQKDRPSDSSADPSFVTPLSYKSSSSNNKEVIDPTFIKFFESELVKANSPGPDYFEFRQFLIKTQEKMASKGGAPPEVVLQAVLMSFEAQDITPAKLIESAKHYKEVIRQKNNDFLKGAEAEKNNQLQKRQGVLRTHDDSIHSMQLELQQLEARKQQINDQLSKERAQMDVDKSLGKEGIEKIDKAERLITLAHDHIQSSIDADINRLQSV